MFSSDVFVICQISFFYPTTPVYNVRWRIIFTIHQILIVGLRMDVCVACEEECECVSIRGWWKRFPQKFYYLLMFDKVSQVDPFSAPPLLHSILTGIWTGTKRIVFFVAFWERFKIEKQFLNISLYSCNAINTNGCIVFRVRFARVFFRFQSRTESNVYNIHHRWHM